jgi:hypothetical protein
MLHYPPFQFGMTRCVNGLIANAYKEISFIRPDVFALQRGEFTAASMPFFPWIKIKSCLFDEFTPGGLFICLTRITTPARRSPESLPVTGVKPEE